MDLMIGQKVAYPNQGVCIIEQVEQKKIGNDLMNVYLLRVLSDNSLIFVPTANAENIGIRPIINSEQYKELIKGLRTDFGEVSSDWKIRSRQYSEKLQSGNVFEAADVLKKLTFLSREKKLSFREQNLLEKAKFLIVSEITNADFTDEENVALVIDQLVEKACTKHFATQPCVMAASISS